MSTHSSTPNDGGVSVSAFDKVINDDDDGVKKSKCRRLRHGHYSYHTADIRKILSNFCSCYRSISSSTKRKIDGRRLGKRNTIPSARKERGSSRVRGVQCTHPQVDSVRVVHVRHDVLLPSLDVVVAKK